MFSKAYHFTQFLRVRRICSTDSHFFQNCFMLSSHFIRRGYPKNLVLTALERASKLDRNDILNKDFLKKSIADGQLTPNNTPQRNDTVGEKNATKRFFCITTHNPLNPSIRDIVSKNWQILGKSSGTRHLVDSTITFGLRRNKNLSDSLVRASTRTEFDTPKHIDKAPCKRPQTCRYCPKLNLCGKVRSRTYNRDFPSKINVNCQSENLIYLITCKTCEVQYVGQTKNRILTRFQGHFQDIKTNNDTTVAQHFNKCSNSNGQLSDFSISVLSFIHQQSHTATSQLTRDLDEKRWMHRLGTILPQGLNLLD